MSDYPFDPLENYRQYGLPEMQQRASDFYNDIRRRRTVREFSDRPVPREVIETCIMAAGTAPNGANLQPWHFAVVESPEIKRQIRAAAEAEEREFYQKLAPPEWLEALAPLGTDEHKPFLEIAPYLIVVFYKTQDELPDGRIVKQYYAQESTGIATGFLINALHHCGLVTLTHTPSPMKFLNGILARPKYERPFLILVTGFPAVDARVPRIRKKPLDRIASFH
jgi:nitroreductase